MWQQWIVCETHLRQSFWKGVSRHKALTNANRIELCRKLRWQELFRKIIGRDYDAPHSVRASCALRKKALRWSHPAVTPPPPQAEPLTSCQGLLPESQGQNLALTVLCVPCSLDSRLVFREGGTSFRTRIMRVAKESVEIVSSSCAASPQMFAILHCDKGLGG